MRALRADAWLLLTSVIWGAAFVAQRDIADKLDAGSIASLRFLTGGLLLLPIVIVRRPMARARSPLGTVMGGGIACGVVMFVAFMLQQRGIEAGSTASAAGFITGLYVLFVPVLGLFAGLRTHPALWAGAGLAAAGLYLLSMGVDLRMSWGDTLVLLCAGAWAVHVLLIGSFSPRCDAIELATAQFLVTGVVATLNLQQLPSADAIRECLWALLYLGPVAVGVAFTLQVVGQRTAPPAHAAVILSLEGIFAVIFGAWLGGERLYAAQYVGCGLMLIGILLAQWPEFVRRQTPAESC
ncbi:MAG: DMT family transporter [Planctomycetes bacterium]|nr:DMT family transporter [Planctomycetota bacterium]